MFKTVLIATDLTSPQRVILETVPALKSLGTTDAVLIQVGEADALDRAYLSLYQSVARESREELETVLTAQGLNVRYHSLSGGVRQELGALVEKEGISMILTTARKHSLPGELLAREPAYDLIHHSPCPVLLVRVKDCDEPKEGEVACARPLESLKHVLFPTDFSRNATESLEYIRQMSTSGVERITVLHVQDEHRISPYLLDMLDEFNETDTKRLNALATELRTAGTAQVDTRLLFGSPTQEILQFARENQADLIVMGSQGRGFIEEVFLGSVSHNVARHADTNVMLIPARRDLV